MKLDLNLTDTEKEKLKQILKDGNFAHTRMKKEPICRKCGKSDWLPVPDSLAIACKECLFVLVLGGKDQSDDGWSEGCSLLQWAADLADRKKPE